MKIIINTFLVLFLFIGCSQKQIRLSPENTKSNILKARDHFTEGMFMELRGENEKALVEYYDALLYDSTSSTIYNRIAQNHIALGRYESALIYLNKSEKIERTNLETHRLMATSYYRLKKEKEAIKHLKTILRYDPFDEDSRNMLILLYRKEQNYLGLAQQYENIMTIYGDDENLVKKTAALYLKNGDNESAKILFIRYLQNDSTNASMWYSLARIHEFDGEIKRAIEGYKNSYKYSEQIDESVERLHFLYKQNEKWDEILNLFSPVFKKDSTNYSAKLAVAEAYYYLENKEVSKKLLLELTHIKRLQWPVFNLLGRIEFDKKNYDQAKIYFQNLIDLDSKSRIGWLFLGFIYSDIDSLDQAEKHYQLAIEKIPDDPYLLSFYGLTLNRLDKDQEAILQLEKALEIDPENINALITLGITLNKVDRKKDAIMPLKKVIRLDENNINAYTTLGMIYDELKMYAASDSLYETSLKIFPDNHLLLNNYAYSLAERGILLDYALEMSLKALKSQPENGAYLDTLGWIYFKLKQYDLALAHIKKAIMNREDNAVVIEHLGDVYKALGDDENATLNWKKALELDPDNNNLKLKIDSY